jgi:TatD DNase family protein
MFTDTHCHILSEYYDSINEIVDNASLNGVNRFIVGAYNYASSQEVLKLINKYPSIYGTVGLHPENCLEFFDYDIFKNLPTKIVAIGEIGLDYHYGKETKDKQIEVFRCQLKIAEDLNLPVVIHSRDATQDTIDILKDYKIKGVIHSFSGSLEVANIYLKMGFKLGVNGVITFKNAKLKDVYRFLKPSDLVLETDSPYLTPEPYRGKQNEPAHIKDIALFLCDLYNISLNELAKITNDNIRDIFDI